MRRFVPIALTVLSTGCSVPNPAFGIDNDAAQGSTSRGAGTGVADTSGRPLPESSTSAGNGDGDGSGDSGVDHHADATTMDRPGSSESTGVATDWWDEYGQRVRISFLPRSEPLPLFTAYVDLNLSGRVLADVLETSVAFVDVASDKELPAEVVDITTSGNRLRAWIELAEWSDRGVTEVDMYFGADAPVPVPQVSPWGPDYLGVWHMDRAPGGIVSNAADGPAAIAVDAAAPTDVAGRVYRSLEFNGANDRLAAVFDASPPSVFTAYAWVSAPDIDMDQRLAFARGGTEGPGPQGSEWRVRTHDDHVHTRVRTGLDSEVMVNSGEYEIPEATWHHYALRASPTEFTLFVDGTQVEQSEYPDLAPPMHMSNTLSIAGYAEENGEAAQYFVGRLDELAWHRDPLSTVWIQTVYENQAAPETTYDVGPVQER